MKMRLILIWILILAALTTACSPEAPVVTPAPTDTPLPTIAATPAPTASPIPVITPTPSPTAAATSALAATPEITPMPMVTPGPRWEVGIDGGKIAYYTEFDAMTQPTATVSAAVKGSDTADDYEGVMLLDVLMYCGLPTDADLDVMGGDGLTVRLPAELVTSPNTLLAVSRNAGPLEMNEGQLMLVSDNVDEKFWVKSVIRLSAPGTRKPL